MLGDCRMLLKTTGLMRAAQAPVHQTDTPKGDVLKIVEIEWRIRRPIWKIGLGKKESYGPRVPRQQERSHEGTAVAAVAWTSCRGGVVHTLI